MKDSHMATPKGSSTKTTPTSVMGSQGKPAPVKPGHFMNKPTGHTKFPSK